MNHMQEILSFLTDLQQNNSKEWMDENRHRYHNAKRLWLDKVHMILKTLSKYDPMYFEHLEPKKCISRITNNRLFKPDLPPYKDYFTFSVMDDHDHFSPLYLSVGVNESFVGCGYHRPDKQTLKNIREAIDYEGQVLKEILESSEFKDYFGGLHSFGDKLKTSPRAYSNDHKFVDLLRYKSFTAAKFLTKSEVSSEDFIGLIEKAYVISGPFRQFLKRANSI